MKEIILLYYLLNLFLFLDEVTSEEIIRKTKYYEDLKYLEKSGVSPLDFAYIWLFSSI